MTGKEHKNFIKDIRKILDEVEINQLKFESVYLGDNGEERICFNLPRLECDLVVSGYSAKYRLVIIKRWQEPKASKNRVIITALYDWLKRAGGS